MKIKLLKPYELGIAGHIAPAGTYAEVGDEYGKHLVAEGIAKEEDEMQVAVGDVEADVHTEKSAGLPSGAEQATGLPIAKAKRPV